MPKTIVFKEKRYIDNRMVPAGKPFTTSAFDAIKLPKGAEVVSETSQPLSEGEPGINATQGAIDLAAKYTIDLNQVGGTGKDGRITKEDVEQFLDGGNNNPLGAKKFDSISDVDIA